MLVNDEQTRGIKMMKKITFFIICCENNSKSARIIQWLILSTFFHFLRHCYSYHLGKYVLCKMNREQNCAIIAELHCKRTEFCSGFLFF